MLGSHCLQVVLVFPNLLTKKWWKLSIPSLKIVRATWSVVFGFCNNLITKLEQEQLITQLSTCFHVWHKHDLWLLQITAGVKEKPVVTFYLIPQWEILALDTPNLHQFVSAVLCRAKVCNLQWRNFQSKFFHFLQFLKNC